MSTLIIGGGISGLACARRLHEKGHPFRLVTDRLGGRMFHRKDGSMNFGATYVNEDYQHVLKFVDKGIPFWLRKAYCENKGSISTVFHWRNLKHIRPMARLVYRLREYRAALMKFRREAEFTSQKDLLVRHSLIAKYARQPASELIRELGLGQINEDYLGYAFRGTCFVDHEKANSLFYLATLFPIMIKTWVADFTRTYERLTSGFQGRISFGKATRLTRTDAGWNVSMEKGEDYHAKNVVIAVPYHNASQFFPVPKPYLPAKATIFAIRGEKRPRYNDRQFVLLAPETKGVALTWRQASGEDLVFCTMQDPDLTMIYQSIEVSEKVTWKTAVVVSNGDWAPLILEPGLFLVGDYNLCGMEDSYISGLCGANRILNGKGGISG